MTQQERGPTHYRGPYENEEGDVWFRASDYTLNEARHEAAQHARDIMGPMARAHYRGKETVPLHDHDWPFYDSDECPEVAAWHFETFDWPQSQASRKGDRAP